MSRPDPINLRDRFGSHYRIARDPSYRAEHGDVGRTVDPWLFTIPCRFGHLSPWGGDRLAASVDGHPRLAARLRSLDCVHVVQDGDGGELTVTFDVADFQRVADLMKPRRRKRLSPEHRRKLVAAGARTRFHGANVEYSGVGRDASDSIDFGIPRPPKAAVDPLNSS